MDPIAVVKEAWRQVHLSDPTDSQATYAAAIADLENGFGRRGQFAAFADDGDYNWGSLHSTARPPCPPGTRQGTDQGNVCFRVFPSDEGAAKAFVWELTANLHQNRDKVAEAMNGSPEDVAQAMHDTRYFVGSGSDPVGTYARAIRRSIASLGKDVPSGGSRGRSALPWLLLLGGAGAAYWWYRHGGARTVAGLRRRYL